MAQTYIDAPIRRREDVRFLTGKATFVDDIKLPHMLHVAILRSPQAHARITAIDTSQGVCQDGKYHGIGLGCFVKWTGLGPYEGARVVIHGANHIVVYLGIATMGQGHETTMAQICADGLGVPIEPISVFHGSTEWITCCQPVKTRRRLMTSSWKRPPQRSLHNALRSIVRTNKRRKAGGFYLMDADLLATLEEVFDDALYNAAFEAWAGQYAAAELAAMLDRRAVLQGAFELIQQAQQSDV